MEIENQIQQHIAQNLLFSEDGFQYDREASFLQEGIIDSMGVMELIAFVGSAFHIQIEPADIIPDNFDSVNKLAAFIRRRQGAAATQPSLAVAPSITPRPMAQP
ncbi:MAG: hypothetical protein JWR19_1168 [Pedosphaera sp.]|nr:hypothetical protein [Pedosphaera sp.]